MPRRISIISFDELADCVRAGMDIKAISKKFNVATSTVIFTARKYGLQIPRSHFHDRKFTKEDLEVLVAKNMTAMDMAEELHVNVSTVRKYLQLYELKPKRVNTHRVQLQEDLMKDAVITQNKREAPIVVVNGKKYRNTFELLWEEPDFDNPYARLDTKVKKKKGLYG